MLAALAALAVALGGERVAAATPSAPRVIIEFSPRAERTVDVRLMRRLVEIELSDAEVPPRPGAANPERRPTVYFRVLVTAPSTLRIELWNSGDYYGARTLSVEDIPEIVARRVALAAAALVRDLAQRRAVEMHLLDQDRERQEALRAELELMRSWPAALIAPRASGAVVGPGDLWLAGPGLAGELRLRSGSRVELGLSWLFGGVPAASGSPSVRWLEAGLTPAHAFSLTPGLDLGVGVTVAAAAAHFTRVTAVDATQGELDTWSARSGLRLTLEPHLGDIARLAVGPELGFVLRELPVTDQSGKELRLGGAWMGLGLSLALDPRARL